MAYKILQQGLIDRYLCGLVHGFLGFEDYTVLLETEVSKKFRTVCRLAAVN